MSSLLGKDATNKKRLDNTVLGSLKILQRWEFFYSLGLILFFDPYLLSIRIPPLTVLSFRKAIFESLHVTRVLLLDL